MNLASLRVQFIVCLICQFTAGRTFAEEVSAQPNVICILSDDQGWADIGYNNPRVYSPNLDKLAAGGVTFTKHYVMPQCTPTRVALMTGRYPSRFGDVPLEASNEPAFPLGTPTLAAMFKRAGYRTYLAGKWHLGSMPSHGPNHFGFDSSYGSLTGAVGMYDHRYRAGDLNQTWHRDHQYIEGSEDGVHATDLVTDEAVRVIRLQEPQPFFLYLPFHAVHTPLDERGKFVNRATQLDPNDSSRWLDEDEIPWFHDPEGKIQRESDPEKRLFLAAVHHLDHAIGRIVEELDKTGKRENTLILFSSDNGPQGSWGGNAYPDDLKLTDFNQPLPVRGLKTDVWEGGIHVPAFANLPGRITPHKLEVPVHIIDWFPTLSALIEPNAKDPPAWDGVNLLPMIFSAEAPSAETTDRDFHWIWKRQKTRWALRYGDWKIVKYGKGEPSSPQAWQLYHLGDDPKETTNVAGEHPEILAAMHDRFLNQREADRESAASE